jgi:hypothetical protein
MTLAALVAPPQNAVAPFDPGAAVEDASGLAEAGKFVRRLELPDIEAAEFVPAARHGAFNFQTRIGVGLPAAVVADVIRRRGRRLREGGAEPEPQQQRGGVCGRYQPFLPAGATDWPLLPCEAL